MMDDSKIKLGYSERDKSFKKGYSELKIKVALNWFEIFALLAVAFFVSLKAISFLQIEILLLEVIIAIVLAIGIASLFACFRKYQLKITRFDKEDIYKKISADLIDEKKST